MTQNLFIYVNKLKTYKFSGRSSIIFHANTEINDDKLKLEDIKINLRLGDVDVHIIKSQNPALGMTYNFISTYYIINLRIVRISCS